eukprot:3562402-Pyramimonas_sp.AAC.1
MDYETSSGHIARIMNMQAKDRLSAEAMAQPFVSRIMGSQEGTFGIIEDRGLSERDTSMNASARRHNTPILPSKKTSEIMLALTEGDSSVDSERKDPRNYFREEGMAQPELLTRDPLKWCWHSLALRSR